jgi:hypothetical protein
MSPGRVNLEDHVPLVAEILDHPRCDIHRGPAVLRPVRERGRPDTQDHLLSPQRIVLGGELSAAADPLREPLHRGMGETAMPAPVRAVEVVGGELGERAAALGGVALALGVDAVPLAVS